MPHASGNWSKQFNRGGLDASVYFVRTDEDNDSPGFLPSGRIGWTDDKLTRFSNETSVAQLRGQYDLSSYWNSSLQFGFTQDRQKGVATLLRPSPITSQLYLLDRKNTQRQPGINELMHPVFDNPALKGEHSAGGEVGGSWRPLPESEVKVSGYYQNYRQMIALQWNPATGG